MRLSRQSGVFMHLTSLPGPHGIGDLGDGSRAFIDFLAEADQSMWQFCPLGPTSPAHANSPYQSSSSFAGNPLLIDLTDIVARGWLTEDDLEPVPDFDAHSVEYGRVGEYKRSLLRTAFDRFEESAADDQRAAFDDFCERESSWLEDYALFAALKDDYEEAWIDWPHELKVRDEAALSRVRDEYEDEIRYREFAQFCFDQQWHELADYAAEKEITLVGDLPIYVALDSADVWAAPEAFDLNEDHEPAVVAGVPPNPDDSGQRWGNPLYDWDHLRETDYGWWMDRLHRLFDLVDVTRIDHFKGFDSYWAIDAGSDSPADGEWRGAPGYDFFETVDRKLGDLPFIVEDLGFLDPSLVDLRDQFAFPGMRVPQYSNWCQEGDMYQPMHYPENTVAYTSTHDTDTFVGYYQSLPDDQRDCLNYNIGANGSEIQWSIIDAVWNSAAVIAFTTMQDLLGLDSHARFNTPGTQNGNWEWRVTTDGLESDVAQRLAGYTDIHIRN